MTYNRQQLTFTVAALLILSAIALGTLLMLRFTVSNIEKAVNPPIPGSGTGGHFNMEKYQSLNF